MTDQAQQVYNAEANLMHRFDFEELTLRECQDLVNLIINGVYWKRNFINYPQGIKVRNNSKSTDTAQSYARIINAKLIKAFIDIPRGMRNVMVVLHELAHLALPQRENDDSHGRAYIKRYKRIVRYYFKEMLPYLNAEFINQGVKG